MIPAPIHGYLLSGVIGRDGPPWPGYPPLLAALVRLVVGPIQLPRPMKSTTYRDL